LPIYKREACTPGVCACKRALAADFFAGIFSGSYRGKNSNLLGKKNGYIDTWVSEILRIKVGVVLTSGEKSEKSGLYLD